MLKLCAASISEPLGPLGHVEDVFATDKATAQEAFKFFKFAFEKGDKMTEDLDYIPMPDAVVKQIEKTWSSEVKT